MFQTYDPPASASCWDLRCGPPSHHGLSATSGHGVWSGWGLSGSGSPFCFSLVGVLVSDIHATGCAAGLWLVLETWASRGDNPALHAVHLAQGGQALMLLVTGALGLTCVGLSEELWGHEHRPRDRVMAEASGCGVAGLRPLPHAAGSPCLGLDSLTCELGTRVAPGRGSPRG